MYGSLAPVLILVCASSFWHHKKTSDQTVHSSVALFKMVSCDQKENYPGSLTTKIALIYTPDLQSICEIYRSKSLCFLRCQ